MSSREVVRAHLARIEEVDPRVNAVTVVPEERALAEADAADRAVREGTAGPLCGVPMTVKENIDVAGSATTWGVPAMRDRVAAHDAPHIAELRAAGAIVIGRTNMPEFGMRWHTANDLRGATVNPWSSGHTPGGSSGGEAVAVATGMSPLGMGGDGAGSLRWPAQCCGVATLKPSLGRVSQGTGPLVPFAMQLMAVNGPLARRVVDLDLAYRNMCARSGGDPWHAPVPLDGPPLPEPLGVALATVPGMDPSVAGALDDASRILTDAGYAVEPREVPGLDRALELFVQIMSAYGRLHKEQPPLESFASADFLRFWTAYHPIWERAGGEAAFDPMMERGALARRWHEWTARTPLVLAPVRTAPAFPVGADLDADWQEGFLASMRQVVAVNLLGLPSVVVPVGEADGLPRAVQVIGPRFREDLCLRAAAAIEAGSPLRTPIDPRA
ncbi:amidase (plasmid) [Spongiactinospora sp. TRM90649]|nr:amidase [Spongiactinospora sp. TRM90649]MDF5751623.1 amidase [Spongiactinospora sp. TRM90649]